MKRYRYNKKPMIVWYGKIFYGMGNVGIAFITQIISGYIIFFGTVVCRVPASLMGIAFSIGVAWDAVTDPIGGYITDNTHSLLFGKRHGFMMAATFLTAIANILVWSVPLGAGVFEKFLWILLSILLLQTSITLFDTPYSALGLDLAGDYHEQTVIQTYKSVFFLIGTIVPTIIMALLQANPSAGYTDGRFDPAAYTNMAYISSIMMLLCGFASYIGTYSHVPRLNKKDQLKDESAKSFKTIIAGFFEVLRDRNYSAVILSYAVSMMASSFLTGVGMYMFTYTFRFTSTQMYILLGFLFGTTILSQPVWSFLSRAIDKKPSMLAGMSLTIAGIIYVFTVFLNMGSFADANALLTGLIPAMVVAGLGIGCLYPLPFSIMADTIAYNTVKNNENRTATFTSFMTFANKLAQAATLLVIGLALEIIGFRTPQGTEVYVPSQAAARGLGYLFCIGVITCMVAAIAVFSRYSLKARDIPNHESVKTPAFEVDRLLSVLESKEKNRKGKNA